MLWAMLTITSAINQAAQIPMMMSQTMSQVAGIIRWASERAARFSFELDPVRHPSSCASPPASVNRTSQVGLLRKVNRAMIQDTNKIIARSSCLGDASTSYIIVYQLTNNRSSFCKRQPITPQRPSMG
jgi:hypothetical protein